jgi:hypothetical protein
MSHHGYELFQAGLSDTREFFPASDWPPKLAEFWTTNGVRNHMEGIFLRFGFLDSNNPKRIIHTLTSFGNAGNSNILIL